MLTVAMRPIAISILLAALPAVAAERQVDPTFLYRSVANVAFVESDMTTATCRYKPLFGVGDEAAGIPEGVARYGVIVVEPGGKSATVSYEGEEQLYYVLDGKGAASYRGRIDADPPGRLHVLRPRHGARRGQ